MRRLCLLAVLCLAGCDLYLGEPGSSDPPPDAGEPPIDEPTFCQARAWCENGNVVGTPPVHAPYLEICPDPAIVQAITTCPDGCAPGGFAVYCGEQACRPEDVAELCYLAPEPARCTQEGAACATEGNTDGCPAEPPCGGVVSVGDCTCTGGAWACEEACNGGLCGPEAVKAAMVGTWTGTVDPPPFAYPYDVTLELRADGHYRSSCAGPTCKRVFYYGEDGEGPDHRYRVVGQTAVGALLVIQMVFDTGWTEGEIHGLRIDGDRMTFQFSDAWGDGCVRSFDFDLRRVAP